MTGTKVGENLKGYYHVQAAQDNTNGYEQNVLASVCHGIGGRRAWDVLTYNLMTGHVGQTLETESEAEARRVFTGEPKCDRCADTGSVVLVDLDGDTFNDVCDCQG